MNDSPPPRRGPRPPVKRPTADRYRRPEKPPLRVQTTTLWEYPSQHYGAGTQGDPRYVGATPSYVIWNLLQRYTEPGGLVVDPMCGSGTTCKIARKHGRHYVGCDISKEYVELAKKRLRESSL